ncbi:MAG: hypothetical protein NTW86_08140 [Candidatus Sumerlaeota bacterium]|nr:hypothetical protein [Candidatus Sumerlaeota bacterium]
MTYQVFMVRVLGALRKMSTAPATPERAFVPDAQRIYNALFAGAIPPLLRGRFERAWPILERNYTVEERAECSRAAGRVNDLEALEFACRFGKRLRILSDQVLLMAFLAETLPDHCARYVDPDAGRLRGLAALAFGALRSSMKLTKGLCLRWRCHVR